MHTLVVGGTGMLAGVAKWLANSGDMVSVLSRHAEQWAAAALPKLAVNGMSVDYRDSDELRRVVANAITEHGPIDRAILWIHSDAPEAFKVVTEQISVHARTPWKLFHVRGSAAHVSAEPGVPFNCLYRQVILGFMIELHGSRWLTHEEISRGVIQAVQGDSKRSIVGTVEPWDQRPT